MHVGQDGCYFVEQLLAEGKHVGGILVDVEKAFDSCAHDIILEKLKLTGLCGLGHDLIRSYLKKTEN